MLAGTQSVPLKLPIYSNPERRGRRSRGSFEKNGGTIFVTNGAHSAQAIMPSTLPPGPAERTVYSYGVRSGNTLYISGMVAFMPDGTIAGEGDIALQAEQVFENMRAVVEEAGGTMDNVVATTTYLTDVSSATVVSQTRAKYFTGPVKPTHTVVGVAALARPQFLVEVSGVAVIT